MQRIVNIEAKAGLRSSLIVRNLDTRYSKGYRSSHNTSSKVQTQGSKDSFRSKKSKPKKPKSTLSSDNVAEPVKKIDKKDKKKRF